MKLFVLVILAVAARTAYGACGVGDVHHQWMSDIATARGAGWTGKTLNQITLMGSHDAVTNTNSHSSKPWYYKWAWADTQDKSLEEQLCAGARFFDLRFKSGGTDTAPALPATWRGHHGGAKFEDAATVFGHIATWAANAGRHNDIVLLRLKLSTKGTHHDQIDAFIAYACGVLGTACAQGDANTIHDKTLAVLAGKTPATHAAVFLMIYDATYNAGTVSAGSVATHNVAKIYADEMTGRYSERIPADDIVKGQQVKYAAKHATKLFGWWMTATPHTVLDKLGSKDVRQNTAKFMAPGGSHRNWITDLLVNRNMAGCTIVTDFVGTVGMASVMPAINTYNDNIAQGNPGAQGMVAACNTPLVYSFLEEENRTPCAPDKCPFCNLDKDVQPKDKSCCLACEEEEMKKNEQCCLVEKSGAKGSSFLSLSPNL